MFNRAGISHNSRSAQHEAYSTLNNLAGTVWIGNE